MDTNFLIAFGLGLVLIYIIGKVMMFPFKWVIKLIVNAVVGAVVLWVVNYFGAIVNFHIPLNPITALTVGFLGVPGIIILIVIQQIIMK